MELSSEELTRRLAAAGLRLPPERIEALKPWAGTLLGVLAELRQTPVREAEPATRFVARLAERTEAGDGGR